MIIVKLIGGLGNQMFQYALGRKLALANNTMLLLDLSGYQHQHEITPRVYGLGVFLIDVCIAMQEEIDQIVYASLVAKLLKIRGEGYVRERASNIFDPDILQVGNNHYLEGYWQTERYFSDIRDILLHDFSLLEDSLNKELVHVMAEFDSIALHVRRGDYVANTKTNQYHGTCSPEYYKKAIEYIAQRVDYPAFFVFSDDIEWVRENIKIEFPVTYVSNGVLKDYEELTLMSKCKHQIIANSSFSWWGAWLNQNPDKIVIAPQKWFNDLAASENDIVPDSWTRI